MFGNLPYVRDQEGRKDARRKRLKLAGYSEETLRLADEWFDKEQLPFVLDQCSTG